MNASLVKKSLKKRFFFHLQTPRSRTASNCDMVDGAPLASTSQPEVINFRDTLLSSSLVCFLTGIIFLRKLLCVQEAEGHRQAVREDPTREADSKGDRYLNRSV